MTKRQTAQRSVFLTQLQASTGNIIAQYETIINEANRILLTNPNAKTVSVINSIAEEYDFELISKNNQILEVYDDELSNIANLGMGHTVDFISEKTELDIDKLVARLKEVINEGVKDLMTTVYPDGLQLSQRLWNPIDREQIARTIIRGYQEGVGTFDLAERIMEYSKTKVFSHSYRVAHTELVRSYSKARYETANDWNNNPDAEFEVMLKQEVSPFHKIWDICFTAWNTPVYTENGWKPIAHIQEGERVLTHKGKMRKVNRIYKNTVYSVDETQIGYTYKYDNRSRERFLKATNNHPVFVNDEWIRIGDVRIGDKVKIMASECKTCGKLIPEYREFCSKSCASVQTAKGQWSNEEHRKNVSNKRNKKNNLEKCADRIRRITDNHNGNYLFMDVEITSVEHLHREQSTPITKWNLGVDKDNSYIARGFVVHNCDVLQGTYDLGKPVPEIPRHPNCVSGDTLIGGRNISSKFISKYDGVAFIITTGKGSRLTITPNHPVLTTRGWVAASKLKEGDYLVRANFDVERMIVPNLDDNKVKTKIKDIVISDSVVSKNVPTSAIDFHGDGAFYKKVDIIFTKSKLRNIFNSNLIKIFSKFEFITRNIMTFISRGKPLQGFRSFNTFRQFYLASSCNLVGTLCDKFPLLKRHSLVTKFLLFAWTSLFDSISSEDGRNISPCVIQLFRNLENRQTRFIEADNVLSVDSAFFHDNVYNIETEGHWYVANDIITHNCACIQYEVYSRKNPTSVFERFRQHKERQDEWGVDRRDVRYY